ncbi:hypothetical protein C6495_11480 [Candidatus Poribacteria bacterium]|nr:MAG: hypothetical protein C6495_11480 [Candidatus Poribacteria bacterium]
MPVIRENYREIRNRMQPGDVIAFSGNGNLSEVIRWATRSQVSHVGVVLQSKLLIEDTPQEGFFNQIIESTSLNGFSGVTITRLSDRVNAYDGDMWWLPLSEESRENLNLQRFFDFLIHHDRRPYDAPQAILSVLDTLDGIPLLGRATTQNVEDFSQFFCSELVAAALEAGGVIETINAAEVTPIDMCRFNLYADEYVQFRGDGEQQIHRFNSIDPTGWGE